MDVQPPVTYQDLAGALEYPLLRPEWTVTTSSALEQDLVDGKLDLAVIVDPVGDRTLRLLPLGAQPNVWAGSPALSVPAGTSPRELTRFTIITTPPPTPMYRNTVAWFAAGGQKPGPLCICTSVNAAAQLAAAGIGIGIFPTRMIEASHLAGTLAAIATDPPLQIGHVYMADHVTADQSRTEAMMRVLASVTRELNYFGPPG